jgi:hypothetical protein
VRGVARPEGDWSLAGSLRISQTPGYQTVTLELPLLW